MQSALRPYVTTGVAIAGAAVIAVSPVIITPQLHLNSSPVASVSADPALTSVATDIAAAVNAVINGFLLAGLEGVGLVTDAIDAGTELFDTTVDVGAGLLAGLVSYPLDAVTAIGGGLVTALVTLLGENPFTLAIADIANGFLGAGEAINEALTAAIGIGAGVITGLVDAGAGLLTDLIETPTMAFGQVVGGFEAALTAFAAGDPAAAIAALTAGFTGAAQTVIEGVTDAFTGAVAVVQTLITAGTQLLTLAIETPLAAGQSIVQGFIDAFNEFFPPQQQMNNLNAGVNLLSADASGSADATLGAPSLRAAATLAPSAGATVAAAPATSTPNPAASTITLPPTSSTTSSDVTAVIKDPATAPGVDLGAAVSTAASGGKSKAGTQRPDTSNAGGDNNGTASGKGAATSAGAGSNTGKSHRHQAA